MSLISSRLPNRLPLDNNRWQTPLLIALAILLGAAAAVLPLPWTVVILGLVVFIILSAIQPLVPLAAALIAGPFGAYENIILGDVILESGQILFLIAVGAWLLNRIVLHPLKIARPPLLMPLILLLLVSAFSLLEARSFESGIKELAKWIEVGIVMVMVLDLGLRQPPIDSQNNQNLGSWGRLVQERWFIIILLAAALVQAIIGIWQFAFQESGPDHFIILERYYRAYGTFMQPNPFGGFMGITASLAVGALIGSAFHQGRLWRDGTSVSNQDVLWLIFLGAATMILIVALVLSWSRGAWMGFAAGVLAFVFFLPKSARFGFALLALTTLGILAALNLNLLPTSLLQRASDLGEGFQFEDVRGISIEEENYSEVERLAHWQAAVEMARDNLWLGVGFGNYEETYPDYQLLNWPFPLGHAHNYYLNLLAETGVVGLLTYLVFWGYIFIQLIKLLKTADWPQRGVALGLLGALTALSIHHLVDKLYVNNMYIFIGAMLGLMQVMIVRNDYTNR